MFTINQSVQSQFAPGEIIPFKLAENSLGHQYMQYTMYDGDPKDAFDYSNEYATIDKMKADYALLLVELQTTPTIQNIEYALKGCKHGLSNLAQYVERLKSDTHITHCKVITCFNAGHGRTDILEKWNDPDWNHRIDEVVRFYMDIKDFALHLANYLSVISKHGEKSISQSQLDLIAQYNIEIANCISRADTMASRLSEMPFFLEVANYNMNYYKCTSKIFNVDLGYFLLQTESILARLYQAITPVEFTSFFLITASNILRILIESPSMDSAFKEAFCKLFTRIDSEIQSYNTRNAGYYHNTHPVFFSEIRYMPLMKAVANIQSNKIKERYIKARLNADFEKNPILYAYSFYPDNLVFGREVLDLLEGATFKYEDKNKRDEALKRLQKMAQPLISAAPFLLRPDELDNCPIDHPLNGKTCDFMSSALNITLLCDTVIKKCISVNKDWMQRIAKQKKPANERKSKLDSLCSDINTFLNKISNIAIEINQLADDILTRSLKKGPISIELLADKSLRTLKDQLKSFSRISKYDLYDVDNEMLSHPLDAGFVDKFIAWRQTARNTKYKELLDEFQVSTKNILASVEKQNANHARHGTTTTSTIPPQAEGRQSLESNTSKHKKRHKKQKPPPPKETSDTPIDIDFTPEVDVETPEVKVCAEEALLDEATSFMSQKRWDEGYKTLDEAVNLAMDNKNSLIYLRSLHARIYHKIGYVNYLKSKVITYEQLQIHDIRANAEKVIYGMKCWKMMINSINYLISQSDSFQKALSSSSEDKDLPISILDKIKTELSDLNTIIQENEDMLKDELDSITKGQQQFYDAHPNIPKKGFGMFGELKSYTRSAIGALAGLRGALYSTTSCLNKSPSVVDTYTDKASVNHIKDFLSQYLNSNAQGNELQILAELHKASANTSSSVISDSVYKDTLLKAHLCDATGVIFEPVKQYLLSHLIKTSDTPLQFIHKM